MFLSKVNRLLPLTRALPRKTFTSTVSNRFIWGGRDDRYSDFSSSMRYMERQMKQFDRDINQLFEQMNRTWTKERQLPLQSADGKSYKIELELPYFKPEDIKVTLKDRMLSIHALKEEIGADGSKNVREMRHQYQIPEDVNLEMVKTFLNPNGTLLIEAPILEIEAGPPKEIPIIKNDNDK